MEDLQEGIKTIIDEFKSLIMVAEDFSKAFNLSQNENNIVKINRLIGTLSATLAIMSVNFKTPGETTASIFSVLGRIIDKLKTKSKNVLKEFMKFLKTDDSGFKRISSSILLIYSGVNLLIFAIGNLIDNWVSLSAAGKTLQFALAAIGAVLLVLGVAVAIFGATLQTAFVQINLVVAAIAALVAIVIGITRSSWMNLKCMVANMRNNIRLGKKYSIKNKTKSRKKISFSFFILGMNGQIYYLSDFFSFFLSMSSIV